MYNRRASDPVRSIYQLGAGSDLLGDEIAGSGWLKQEKFINAREIKGALQGRPLFKISHPQFGGVCKSL